MNWPKIGGFVFSRKFLLSAAFVLLFVFFIYSSLYITEEQTRRIVDSLGIFGPVFIYLMFLASQIVAPLTGSPVAFIGFKLYGYTYTLVIIYLSFLTSAIINFFVARELGAEVVRRLAGEERLRKIEDISLRKPTSILIPARLLLTGSADIVSYVMGLSNIRPQVYFLVSALVPLIPILLFWTLFHGLNFHNLTDITYFYSLKITIDAVSYALFVFILIRQKRLPTPGHFIDILFGRNR